MIEWTQTGTVHCHIWRDFLQCLNNQIHASLFHLAFCFHQHITSKPLHSHWLLWITRDTSKFGLFFAALNASPIVCFSTSSSSFTRYSAASVQQQWVLNMKMETKWNDAKQKRDFHFITHCLLLIPFWFLILCFVAMRLISLLSTHHWCCYLPIWRENEEWIVDECLLCFFLLSSRLRLSSVSVVFDFNDSLNDVAPASPISFTVNEKRKGKEWIVDGCLLCVFFLLSLLQRASFVSVVFDFNASLNDVAPVSPMLLTVDVMRKGKGELLAHVFCVSSFFCLHNAERVSWVLCLISMLHSMVLLLCLQCHWLLM